MQSHTVERKSKNNKRITKTWLTGHSSCTLVIPKEIARDFGLDKPSHVILETIDGGILIKKFEL